MSSGEPQLPDPAFFLSAASLDYSSSRLAAVLVGGDHRAPMSGPVAQSSSAGLPGVPRVVPPGSPPPRRVALGDEEGEGTAARQWYSQGLAELGSSIFISTHSNGGRGGNISDNFLLCL